MRIKVRVTPNAKTEEIVKKDDRLLMNVKEPPREGKANKAVMRLLADYYNISQDCIVISSGSKSRDKVIEVFEDPHRRAVKPQTHPR